MFYIVKGVIVSYAFFRLIILPDSSNFYQPALENKNSG
jgi:hypothetical protein